MRALEERDEAGGETVGFRGQTPLRMRNDYCYGDSGTFFCQQHDGIFFVNSTK